MTPDIRTHRRYIEAALEYADGTYTFEDVERDVHAGRLQFWPGETSAVITEIIDYPQQRALNYFLAGGNLAELEAMWPVIETWGRSQGCTHALFTGRKGWERTFVRRIGFQPKLVVFTKELGNGEEA